MNKKRLEALKAPLKKGKGFSIDQHSEEDAKIYNELGGQLEKGRKPEAEGTIKVFNGKHYRKEGGKWKYISKKKKIEREDIPEPKTEKEIPAYVNQWWKVSPMGRVIYKTKKEAIKQLTILFREQQSEKSKKEPILKLYKVQILSPTEFMKARALAVGTIQTWKGKKYRKVAAGKWESFKSPGRGKEAFKTYKGVHYFKDEAAAKKWAGEHGWPTDRIVGYERGFAIQAGASGNYAGPGEKPKAWKGTAKGVLKKDDPNKPGFSSEKLGADPDAPVGSIHKWGGHEFVKLSSGRWIEHTASVKRLRKKGTVKQPWEMSKYEYAKMRAPELLPQVRATGLHGGGGRTILSAARKKAFDIADMEWDVSMSEAKKAGKIPKAMGWQQTKAEIEAKGLPAKDYITGGAHKRFIQSALKQELPVPSEVLADYPDIEKQFRGKSMKHKLVIGQSQEDEILALLKALPTIVRIKPEPRKSNRKIPSSVKSYVKKVEAAFEVINQAVADLVESKGLEGNVNVLKFYKDFKEEFQWKVNDAINYPNTNMDSPVEAESPKDESKVKIEKIGR